MTSAHRARSRDARHDGAASPGDPWDEPRFVHHQRAVVRVLLKDGFFHRQPLRQHPDVSGGSDKCRDPRGMHEGQRCKLEEDSHIVRMTDHPERSARDHAETRRVHDPDIPVRCQACKSPTNAARSQGRRHAPDAMASRGMKGRPSRITSSAAPIRIAACSATIHTKCGSCCCVRAQPVERLLMPSGDEELDAAEQRDHESGGRRRRQRSRPLQQQELGAESWPKRRRESVVARSRAFLRQKRVKNEQNRRARQVAVLVEHFPRQLRVAPTEPQLLLDIRQQLLSAGMQEERRDLRSREAAAREKVLS